MFDWIVTGLMALYVAWAWLEFLTDRPRCECRTWRAAGSGWECVRCGRRYR